jgi:hypothetical protein
MSEIVDIFDVFRETDRENDTLKGHIKKTLIYCEGWLLRLILYWFNENKNTWVCT